MAYDNFAQAAAMSADCGPEMPPRSFNALNSVLGRLKVTTRQLDEMLDRIAPTPKTVSDGASSAVSLGPRAYAYAETLDAIDRQLDVVGSLIDQLERHI